jgi:hypothetical protein
MTFFVGSVEYLGSTQNHTKQLDELKVEYLGSTQNYPKKIDGLKQNFQAVTYSGKP